MKSKNIIDPKTIVKIKETIMIYFLLYFLLFVIDVWFGLSQNSFYIIISSLILITMTTKDLNYIKLLFSKKINFKKSYSDFFYLSVPVNMALILLTLKNINNPIHSKSVISIIIDIFLVVFLAPVCEELIFRAYTQKLINNYSNKWIAIILTSAIFGIPHNNYLQAFIKSLCFGYIYSKFDNIKLSILLHSFGNMLVIMYEILGTYSYNIIKIIYLLLSMLLIIVYILNLRQNKPY